MARDRKRRPSFVVKLNSNNDESEDIEVFSQQKTELTLVVLGTPRGGTTMVAGIAQRCGIDIGRNLPVNLEDPDFVEKEQDHMLSAIMERNRTKRVWGWKFPRAAAYLPNIQSHLVNPHYVIVWRDIYSASHRRVLKGEDQIAALNWAQSVQEQNLRLIDKLNGPVLMVSYARAVSKPAAIANDICEFVGIQPAYDITELYEFALPGSYKSSS